MSDTANLSGMAPGYKFGTQSLSDGVSAFMSILMKMKGAEFGKSGVAGKIWKGVKLLWTSRKLISTMLKSAKGMSQELLDLNAEEMKGVNDYLWNNYSDKFGPEGRVWFDESLGLLTDLTRRFRRLQNVINPPRAEVLPE